METTILAGDCLERLKDLTDESVHCVVTSPPYWGLRSYQGDPGMIGLEPSFEEHLENLVAMFREVRRVLRDDGTLWLNYGDAYANDGKWGGSTGGKHANGLHGQTGIGRQKVTTGLKPKDLMMMPARVAMALQADGWWLRSEIIWHKPNPMPESVTDRPTSAHEKLFLLSKSAKYFYDAEAVRTPTNDKSKTPDGWDTGKGSHGKIHKLGRTPKDLDGRSSRLGREPGWRENREPVTGANLRNVWKIATAPFKEAHFATFPIKLVEPCVLAGTSEKGCCAECGAPWVRVVDKEVVKNRPSAGKDPRARGEDKLNAESKHGHKGNNLQTKFTTTGWSPTCEHDSDPVPATVLDPFAGAGTVGLVAQRLGRSSVMIEISEEYALMARDRISKDMPLFSQVELNSSTRIEIDEHPGMPEMEDA